MSTIFDLDNDGARALDELARLNPLRPEDVPLPAWAGSGEALKGLLRPSASAGRAALVAGAAVPVVDDALTSFITGKPTTSSQDWYFRNVVDEVGSNAVDYWTPDPGTLGSAAKALNVGGMVVGSLPQMLGTPGLFLGASGIDPATELVREGVDADTAAAVGGVQLIANAIGMRLPAAWGTTLGTRVATGAGANLAVGAGADALSAGALRTGGPGYAEQAERFALDDPYARALDVLMGAAFGFKANADAPRLPVAERDAVLTARNQVHAAAQTMPGEPTSPAAQRAHATSLSAAIEQLARGEAVNVADAINPADFVLRPELRAAMAPRPANVDDYGALLVALESGGNPNAKASTSSATGLHQFTERTWLRTVREAAPAWAQGLDDAAVLALRTDPAKSAEMELTLREANAAALQRAGLEPDAWNLYAAHHFGEAGGIRFGKAAGDTPMSKILSREQLDANPYLRNLTKAQAIDNWAGRARRAGVEVRDAMPADELAIPEAPRQVADTAAPEAPRPGDAAAPRGELPDSLRPESAARTATQAPEAPRPRVAEASAAGERTPGVERPADQPQAGPRVEPGTPLAELQRIAAERPDAVAVVGFDADDAPAYRPVADALAEIDADYRQAANEAEAFTAAASCFIRSGA